jgi:oligogalacturonide transporter
MNEPRKVKTGNIVFYGLGDIFGGGSFLLISMFYLFFLTEEVGLSPLVAGVVLGAGKAWDAIADPLMGHISDRTRSRFGRRRLYFLLGVMPIALSFYLLWIPIRGQSQLVTALYYGLAYVVFNTVFTMVMVPYSALSAEMTADYRARNLLTAARTLCSLLSAALAGTMPSLLLAAAPSPASGYLRVGLVFGLIYALPFLLVFAGTWEMERPERAHPPFSLGSAVRGSLSLLENRSFRVHIAMYICAYTAMDALMILFRYYLRWNIGKEIMPQTMGALMAGQILTIPFYVRLANRRGQATAFRVGLTIFAAGMAFSYALGSGTRVPVIMAVCAFIGAGLSAAVMVPWAILPSIVDVDELMTGEARSGAYAGAMTLLRKLVQGLLATPAISLALTLIGYAGGTGSGAGASRAQSPETVARLKVLFFAMPSVFIVLAVIASLRFLITPGTQAVIRSEIERLRAGGAREDASPETRATVEAVTGKPYAASAAPDQKALKASFAAAERASA